MPVKFSTSEASRHRAYDSFFHKSKAPWYQVYCVTASVAVFLLYFCVLREENDVDEYIGRSIYQKIPPFREQVLEHKIKEGKQSGSNVGELEEELKEIHKKYK